MKTNNTYISRDGTGQNQREAKALNPDYIKIDERSAVDFIKYAQELSTEIKYFNNKNIEDGDWSLFLQQGNIDLENIKTIEDYLGNFTGQKLPPHIALFLSFLKLLEYPKEQLNKLTDRHLDFFYNKILGLKRKPAEPDITNVIIEPDETIAHFLLKKDTLFKGGENKDGSEIIFKSVNDVFVNKAKVNSLKNLFARKEIIDIQYILEHYRDTETAFNKILKLVYGEPNPGDPLPDFNGLPVDYVFFVDYKNQKDGGQSFEKQVIKYAKSKAGKGGDVNTFINELFQEYFYFNKNIFDAIAAALQNNNITASAPYFENAYIKRIYHKREIALEEYYNQLITKYGADDAKKRLVRYIWGEPAAGDPIPLINQQEPNIFALGTREAKDNTRIIFDSDAAKYIEENLLVTTEDLQQVINYFDGVNSDKGLCFSILEEAQRNKRSVPVPVARITNLRDVYYAKDPKELKVEFHPDFDEAFRWKTFGRAPLSDNDTSSAIAIAGFAITSPVLQLGEGQRNITIVFDMEHGNAWDILVETIKTHTASPLSKSVIEGNENEELVAPFRFFLSGEKGMFEVEATMSCTNQYQWICVINLSEKDQKVTKLPEDAVTNTDVSENWPVLKIFLNSFYVQNRGEEFFYYQWFKELLVKQVKIDVEVQNIKKLLAQNDDTAINPAKPFEPFGLSPSDSFGFYFTHPEIYFKDISELSLNLEWLNLPANFVDYYNNYGFPVLTKDKKYQTFKVTAELFDQTIVAKSFGDKELFGTNKNVEKTLSFNTENTITLNGIDGLSNYEIEYNEKSEVLEQGRYIKLELGEPDFQHAEYPVVSSQVSIKLAKLIAGNANAETDGFTVNQPYTPKLKKMLLGYKASAFIHPEDKVNDQDKIFHIYSYGYKEIVKEDTILDVGGGIENNLYVDVLTDGDTEEKKVPKFYLLPQFDNEGELYIGLENVDPPQNLSLLFQMAEGSASPDIVPPPVQWWYLSNNQWKTIDDGSLLGDTTNGLIQTGILTINIPGDATSDNSLLTNGQHWIKATVKQDTGGLCDTIEILAQAISTIRVMPAEGAEQLSVPLLADSISKFKTAVPEIKSVKQPYNSTGGTLSETKAHFHLRISERLRHKNRAITAWDYERLVLEKFPNIYKVKCLAAQNDEGEELSQNLTGKVTLIVVPDIRNKVPFNPFEPKVPSDQLLEIKEFLEQRMPPWSDVEIKNPRYIQVKIKAFVRFRQGYNEGFYKNKLNQDLLEFLAPWAFDNSAEIVFSNKIHAGSIINFIDKREYIDFVGKINVFQKNTKDYFEEINLQESGGTALDNLADAIIVSASEHYIHSIVDDDYDEKEYAGIGFMRIELDFAVN